MPSMMCCPGCPRWSGRRTALGSRPNSRSSNTAAVTTQAPPTMARTEPPTGASATRRLTLSTTPTTASNAESCHSIFPADNNIRGGWAIMTSMPVASVPAANSAAAAITISSAFSDVVPFRSICCRAVFGLAEFIARIFVPLAERVVEVRPSRRVRHLVVGE